MLSPRDSASSDSAPLRVASTAAAARRTGCARRPRIGRAPRPHRRSSTSRKTTTPEAGDAPAGRTAATRPGNVGAPVPGSSRCGPRFRYYPGGGTCRRLPACSQPPALRGRLPRDRRVGAPRFVERPVRV
jgi:hypothetical protein